MPEVDELAPTVRDRNPEICTTGTWLNNKIPDDVIQMYNYTLQRRDRKGKKHALWRMFLSICKN